MVEILTLEPVTKIDEISKNVLPPASGLPINSLPGWDRVPLCNKLPMLDTPTNEIIFSRDKMGKMLWKPSEFVLYDPNCYQVKLDYDPLHDPHLRNFYSRPVNLQRIKRIGRITDDKDVICTLKEFNDYRRYLRRLHLDLINNEIKKQEIEQRDRFLISTAVEVANKQYEKMEGTIAGTKSNILHAKEEIERQFRERVLQAAHNLKRTVEKIARMKQLKMEALQEKSRLHNLEIQYRVKRAEENQKMRIISLKRKIENRDTRLREFLRNRFEVGKEAKLAKNIMHWQRRLEFRAWKHEHRTMLRRQIKTRRAECVQRHKQNMQKKWERIRMQIAEKSNQRHKVLMKELTRKLHKKLDKKKKNKKQKPDESFLEEHITRQSIVGRPSQIMAMQRKSSVRLRNQNSKGISLDISKHSKQDMRDALTTAISLYKVVSSVNPETNGQIINSAKFILEKVLKTVTRNLGEDLNAQKYLSRRIADTFSRAKKHILMKVERVLQVPDGLGSRQASNLGFIKSGAFSKSLILPLWSKSINTMSKAVSFGEIVPIGKTDQEIDSAVELRSVKSRTPTPASSLTSLNAIVRETCSDEDVLVPAEIHEHTYRLPDWTMHERIFVEHFYIKFKKALLVGVEHSVFDAIDFKKREFRFNSRREILEFDRDYLIKIMAESILTYNLNSYNYAGNLRLCISVLAAECLYDLQNSQLKPKYDPNYYIEPRCRCSVRIFGKICTQKSACCF